MSKVRRWLHDFLGWGYPTKRDVGDAFQPTYSCAYCDRELTADSTGAWFHL